MSLWAVIRTGSCGQLYGRCRRLSSCGGRIRGQLYPTECTAELGVTHGGSEDSGENSIDCRLGCLVCLYPQGRAGDGQSRFKCLKFLEEKHLLRQFGTRQAARYQHIVQAEGLSNVNFPRLKFRRQWQLNKYF